MKPAIIILASIASFLFPENRTCYNDDTSISAGEPIQYEIADTVKFQRELDEILTATNQCRQDKGLTALSLNTTLSSVAQAYAQLMVSKDKLDHGVDDMTSSERMTAAGYNWRNTGENIALHNPLVGAYVVTDQWMKSRKHRKNILSKNFTEIGIGIAGPSKNGLYYYCQDFGRPQ